MTVVSAVRLCITIWLPRRRTSRKPCRVRIWQTSRPERIRSLPNRDFEARDENLASEATLDFGGIRGLEEKLYSFNEIPAGFLNRVSLACDIQFRAQRDVPRSLSLNDRCQLAILPHRFPLNESNIATRVRTRAEEAFLEDLAGGVYRVEWGQRSRPGASA